MKSIKKYIIIACLVICMTGCGQAKEKDNTAENVKESVSQNTDDGKLYVRVHNPYFYEKEVTNLNVSLEYCEGDVTISPTVESVRERNGGKMEDIIMKASGWNES